MSYVSKQLCTNIMFQKHAWRQGNDQPWCSVVLIINFNTFFHGLTVLMGLSFLILEVSRSHSDTPNMVGLLWMSDQPVAETSTCTTDNTHKRQTSTPPVGFEPAIPASEQLQTHSLDRKPTNLVPHLTLTYTWMIYLQAWFREIIHDGLNHWQLSHQSNFTSLCLAPLIYSANKSLFLRFV
jgi:hypothetical protein